MQQNQAWEKLHIQERQVKDREKRGSMESVRKTGREGEGRGRNMERKFASSTSSYRAYVKKEKKKNRL